MLMRKTFLHGRRVRQGVALLAVACFTLALLMTEINDALGVRISLPDLPSPMRSQSQYIQQIPILRRQQESFRDFLDRAAPNPSDLVWITLADGYYTATATTHLHHALAANGPLKTGTFRAARQHKIIVLCLDEGCMQVCKERAFSCYDGFRFDKPEIMLPATWPKLAGIIGTLESGRDMMFIDSDVFLRG